MRNDPIKLAVIGAGGRIAADYLTVLADLDRFEIRGAVEVERAAHARIHEQLGVTPHPELDDLVATTPLDAALVLTPPATHADLSIRLLEAGVHVFCEKPLTTSTADATRLLEAAERAGRHLMLGSKFRFVDDVTRASELLGLGAIGRPLFYDMAFCGEVDMTGRWNSDPALSGGGVLIDNGTHAVDVARYLLGDLSEVAAFFGPRLQPIEVEDTVRMVFSSVADGTLGRVDLSWSTTRATDTYVAIHGTEGEIELRWRNSRWRRHGEEWTEFGCGYNKHRAFRNQLAHFADVLQLDATPLITVRDAYESVRLIDAAYESAVDFAGDVHLLRQRLA